MSTFWCLDEIIWNTTWVDLHTKYGVSTKHQVLPSFVLCAFHILDRQGQPRSCKVRILIIIGVIMPKLLKSLNSKYERIGVRFFSIAMNYLFSMNKNIHSHALSRESLGLVKFIQEVELIRHPYHEICFIYEKNPWKLWILQDINHLNAFNEEDTCIL